MSTKADNGSVLLTTREVALHLLSDPRLRGIRTMCALPAIRVGSEWRIRPADLEAWIARNHRRLATEAPAPRRA